MYKFIDLFCGIGGFRVALEERNMECVFSCDIDTYAQEAYRRNFGETPRGDITAISEKKIPKHDILCAGFPCQPFSISGSRGGISDVRGRLFYEIVRIAAYHQPSVLLLENVKNILTMDKGKVVQTIENKLSEIGYTLQKYVLNSSHFGVPQSRERVYFVGVRKDIGAEGMTIAPQKTLEEIFLEDILEESVDKKFIVKRTDVVLKEDWQDASRQLKPIRIGSLNKGGQGERIYSPKGHAITLSAYGGGVGARTGLYMTSQGLRRLTITEGKRVMGFSDSHVVSDGTQGYQQLGNAVIPNMIGYVWDSLEQSVL